VSDVESMTLAELLALSKVNQATPTLADLLAASKRAVGASAGPLEALANTAARDPAGRPSE